MHKIDNRFIEGYKKMNRLCCEIYHSNEGVNDYLREMEKKSYGASRISGWNDDYKTLKHLRHVRNQIAHDDTEANTFCTDDDMKKLKDFFRRLDGGKDPLALLKRDDRKRNGTKREWKWWEILALVVCIPLLIFLVYLLVTNFNLFH
ncbi:MAG: hypothetical protein MJ092_00045 [Lachnospiraceae bacterium]|nr:hypothetical protein [Lachnospiraceae bacterium]